jgi:hypothetical protein
VTLLNFLTIGTPALLITLSRERSAAAFSASDFLREVGWFAVRTGVVIGVAGLLLMLAATHRLRRESLPVEAAEAIGLMASPQGSLVFATPRIIGEMERVKTVRTLLLSALILLGLTTLLRALTHGETHPLPGDRPFRWFAATAVSLYLAAMYWRPAAYFFELTPLGLGQWLWVLAFVAPAYLLLLLTDRRAAGRGQPRSRSTAQQPRT